jgi:CheY-like chemotaxis protein
MKRIAVVEDNADNQLLVRAMLEDLYEITPYETGRQALEGLRSDRPDLVLLDISLPDMEGTDLLRSLREEPSLSGLPVVALTAHAMAGDEARFLAAGFDGYISKPIVEEHTLLDAIERALRPGGG